MDIFSKLLLIESIIYKCKNKKTQGHIPNEARFRNTELITPPSVETSDLLYLIKLVNDLSLR